MSEKEKTEAIIAEIEKGINNTREAIKLYGATIPKSDITVTKESCKQLKLLPFSNEEIKTTTLLSLFSDGKKSKTSNERE